MDEDADINDDEFLPTDTVTERWGEAADAGFIPFPNALVRAQATLELTANDMVVILNILLHWWHRDRLPHPRSTAIAKRSGLGHRTVQRSLSNLERQGLIARVRGPKGKAQYDLTGLRDALARQARRDVWYRPEVVRKRPSGRETRAGAGLQNPNP
jgi:DNA-binding HxlR family transcriptional regulator